mgnify:CR=1 FL=1
MKIDLTPVFQALIGLISLLITTILIPWIKRKINESKRNELAAWVQIAVHAAEQIIKGTKAGQARREWVLSYLRDRGYDLDDEEIAAQIDAMIEAFVLELKRVPANA